MLQAVAQHYEFDLDVPYQELAKEHKKIILDGSGDTKIAAE